MITIWIIYSFAALAASGMFLAAGWRSKRARVLAASRDWQGVPADPLWGDAEIDIDAEEARSDIGAVFRLALKRMAPAMAGQSVQAEIAVPFGLLVRMRGAVLAELLEDLLAIAIQGAPASRLLVTATTHGDRIHVGVTDDMAGGNLELRQSSARGLLERVAMRGLTLDINVRPREGTSMILRLPVFSGQDELDPAAEYATGEHPAAEQWHPAEPAMVSSGSPAGFPVAAER